MVYIAVCSRPTVLNLRKMRLDKKRTHVGVTLIYFEFDVIGCLLLDKKFKENITSTI